MGWARVEGRRGVGAPETHPGKEGAAVHCEDPDRGLPRRPRSLGIPSPGMWGGWIPFMLGVGGFYICEPTITHIYLCGRLCVLLDCFLQIFCDSDHRLHHPVLFPHTLLCAPTQRVVGVEGEC